MKITAIIEDNTIKEAMKYSNASTITEALKIALNEFISNQKLKELAKEIKKNPLTFKHSADTIRGNNREQ